MIKILYLNCANRKNQSQIKQYLLNNNIDIAILADANSIKNLNIDEYPFRFASKYVLGMFILSKYEFSTSSIDYTIDDKRIGINPDKHQDRLVEIKLTSGLNILAVYVDYGWYNTFAMRAIEDYIKTNDINIIIGDFNSGYIDDNIDLDTGGVKFQNGYLFFDRYEKMGFFDPHKGSGTYTHINQVKKRRFRLDHCFIKDKSIQVEHIDDFLDNNISDHKGLLVTTP